MRALRIFLIGSGAITWLLILSIGGYLWLGGFFYVKNAPLFDALLCAESTTMHSPLEGGGIYLRSSCVRGIYQFRGSAADVSTMNSDWKYLGAVFGLPDYRLFSQSEAEEMLNFWLSHGANINIQSQESGATLLQMSADTDDVSTVELLIKHGARTDIRNKAGHTPLESLRLQSEKIGKKPNEEIVKLLAG
jgi:hypothetical protein